MPEFRPCTAEMGVEYRWTEGLVHFGIAVSTMVCTLVWVSFAGLISLSLLDEAPSGARSLY